MCILIGAHRVTLLRLSREKRFHFLMMVMRNGAQDDCPATPPLSTLNAFVTAQHAVLQDKRREP